MPATVMLDELHLTFSIPAALTSGEVRAIRRVLTVKAFTAAVRRAVLAVMNKSPELKPVRVTVAR
jgi:hypothetical protein